MNKLLASAFVVLFASCAVLDNIPQQEPDNQILQTSNAPAPSLEEQYDSGYWVATPLDGMLTVLGIAGRQSTEALSP